MRWLVSDPIGTEVPARTLDGVAIDLTIELATLSSDQAGPRCIRISCDPRNGCTQALVLHLDLPDARTLAAELLQAAPPIRRSTP